MDRPGEVSGITQVGKVRPEGLFVVKITTGVPGSIYTHKTMSETQAVYCRNG
jgi:hypothetical protein